MQNFLNDFKIFFDVIFDLTKNIFEWFIATIPGKILLFVIIISLFYFLINLFIDFKD